MGETEDRAENMLKAGGANAPPAEPKRRGRPPGSKNRPKENDSSSPTSVPTEGLKDKLSKFEYQETPESVFASTMMGATIWAIVAPMFKLRKLTDEEEIRLGLALDPVLQRWVPMFDTWKYEINLVVTIVALAKTCSPPSNTESSVTDAG